MKLAVFANQAYYPTGGAGDFRGFAPNGTAAEILDIVLVADDSVSIDYISLLDCEGVISGAHVTVHPDGCETRLTIHTKRLTSPSWGDQFPKLLNEELLAAFKTLPGVIVK